MTPKDSGGNLKSLTIFIELGGRCYCSILRQGRYLPESKNVRMFLSNTPTTANVMQLEMRGGTHRIQPEMNRLLQICNLMPHCNDPEDPAWSNKTRFEFWALYLVDLLCANYFRGFRHNTMPNCIAPSSGDRWVARPPTLPRKNWDDVAQRAGLPSSCSTHAFWCINQGRHRGKAPLLQRPSTHSHQYFSMVSCSCVRKEACDRDNKTMCVR